MEWNQQTLEFFSQCFFDKRSDQPEQRIGIKNLSDVENKRNYCLNLLRFVTIPSVDENIRYWAAFDLKYRMPIRWKPSLSEYTPIPDTEKEEIKKLIIPLRLSEPSPRIQWSLSKMIALAIRYDMIPELKLSLEHAIYENDFASVSIILSTFNDMFKIFRYLFGLDPIMYDDYKYCLDNFSAPLLTTVESLSVTINDVAATGSAEDLCHIITAQRYCCRILFSLNYFGMPDFEDNADKWMKEFKNYLTFSHPFLEESGAKGRVIVDGLCSAVFNIITDYVNHDMFQKYLRGFVEAVWSFNIDIISATQIGEALIVDAINFFINVNTWFPHELFSGDLKNYLKILDHILLKPNLWRTRLIFSDLEHLLQSFIQHAPNELNTKERLQHVVGSVITYVSSPNREEKKFNTLNQLIENLGYDVMAEHMIQIWASLLINPPQNSKTENFVRCLIVFMSRFLIKHGIQTLVDSINSVEENIFLVILGEFWIPNLKTLFWNGEIKLCAIALTKLLCESSLLLDLQSGELWGKLLDGIVTLLSRLEKNIYNEKEDPLVKEIIDPKRYLVDSLTNLCCRFPGRFRPIINIYLSFVNHAELFELCYSYNCNMFLSFL